MTSQSDATNEIIAFYVSLIPEQYCLAAVAAFVMYDWIVTLSREVQLFWTGEARPLSAALYFSTKYLNLFSQVPNIGTIWDLSIPDKGCLRFGIVEIILLSLSIAPPAVFAGLRAYALTQRRWLAALVLLLSGTPVISNMLRAGFLYSGYQFPIIGLLTTDRVLTILADTLLIVITWKQIMPSGATRASRHINVATTKGLASVMLYDGMLYFVVLLTLNIIQLVCTELSVLVDGESSLVGNFTSPLSSILVCHFLLDLQEAHQRKVVGLATNDPLNTSQSISIRSVKFMPALGSLAATIDPADYDREGGNEGVDEDSLGVSEYLAMRSEGSESTGDVPVEDVLAIHKRRSQDREIQS